MASFIVYDLVFLVLFSVSAFLILRKNKQNLKRQGWIFLYHTKVGIKLMDWASMKFGKLLKPLSYVVIASGYALMGGILWMITKTVWIYVSTPIPDQLKNLPPIAPLIPYFPKLFNLESFFPPLYFTYFLVALAVVALSHEFSHGLFARLWKIKVKTTGLAFFGPFFGAFVEPDEKQMAKAPKKHQLSILAAGTFANIVMFVLFGVLLALFFSLSFAPAGVIFNSYSQGIVNVSQITHIGNVSVTSLSEIPGLVQEGLNKITTSDKKIYYAPKEALTLEILENNEQIILFDDAPAVKANLVGAITSIDGKMIRSQQELSSVLYDIEPGKTVVVTTIDSEKQAHNYDIKLGNRNGSAYLGIGFYSRETGGFGGLVSKGISKFKNPNIYYAPTWDGDFAQFIYDLLWWVVIINILVALMNMLPVSILDGGRFFYLTILGITGNASWAKKAYSWVTWFILLLLAIMMGKWFVNLF
ncbi:MAG: site-2 protease family protein [Nanoarchaeota archaeon]